MGFSLKLGEIFTELGFKSKDDTKLQDFIKSIGDLSLKSVASVFGVTKLYEGLYKIMEIADQTALGMYLFSSQTGMSAQKMQQWSNLAGQMGVSAEDVISSVKRLQDGVARMRLTGEGAQGWMLLGIDPTTAKDSFELLSRVREAIKSLSPEYQRLALQQVGLSESMLSMMKVSDDMWASSGKLIKNTDEQTEALMRNHGAWAKLKAEWRILLADLGTALAPFLEVIARVLDWIVASVHKSKVVRFTLETIIGAVGVLIDALMALIAVISVLAIAGWISGLSEIALVIGAIAAGLALIAQNWDKVKGFFGGIGNKVGNWLAENREKNLAAFSPASFAIPDMSMPAAGSVSTKTNHNQFHFSITGGSSEEIANKVDEKIQRMFSDGEYQTRE